MGHKITDEFLKTLHNGMLVGTYTSCSRWANKCRLMGGDFPGAYSWEHHPWVKELHDSWAPYNYVMKGAQLGVTEVAINRALYTLDQKQRDVLYVLPTMLNAGRFSKSRFTVALGLSEYIRRMFTDINSINLKQTATNSLHIGGAKGRSNLKNIPASELILDELDEMDQEQIGLALERLTGNLQKHVFGISTPSVPEHGIHKLYNDSTQEHFFFECPCCGRTTELLWPDCVEICGEHTTDPRCKESFLKCKECGGRLEQRQKPEFLSEGHWEKTAPNSNPDVRGFQISQLYSFTVTPGDLVVAYFRGFGDEFSAKEFHNSKLGLPFVGAGARVTDEWVANSIRDHSMDATRPSKGGRLITMGIDQGQTICHAVICEWFFDKRIGHDLSNAAICKVLWVGTFGAEDWDYAYQLMSEWQVAYCVVDADPQINEARQFCRYFNGYAATTRYRRGKVAKEVVITDEDTGAPMLTVDRSAWLATSQGRFKTDPTRIWLPRDILDEFKKQVCNLVRSWKKDDKTGEVLSVYINVGPDHFGHALAYSEIALHQAPLPMDTKITSY